EWVCGGAADLHRDMLVRLLFRPDFWIKVVDADQMHVPEVVEEISLAPCVEPDPFFKQKVPGKDHAVLVAPVADLPVIRLRVLLRERPPEIVTDSRRLRAHRRVERREMGPQIIPAPLAEDLEHLLRPGDRI